MIRTLLFYPSIIISLIFSLPASLKVKSLDAKGKSDEKAEYIHKTTKKWASFIMKLSGAKIDVKGLENIPKDKTILFVSNHQSNFDIPLLLSCLDVPKGFIAKKELESWPIVSTWMKHLNCIFMDRSNLRKSAQSIVEGIKILKSGYSMVIFPEGTRSKGKPIEEFKSGSFKLATKSKCTIVPLTINGTYKLFEQNNNKIKAAPVELVIHPAIDVASLSEEELEVLPQTVYEIVKSAYKNS